MTYISKELRKQLQEWREKTLEKYNHRCVISGLKEKLAVHHLNSFGNIVRETITELLHEGVLDESWIHDTYHNDSFIVNSDIQRRFHEKHSKYGLGVVLHKGLHQEFHRIYGHKNNTPGQLDEFRRSLKNGRIKELVGLKKTISILICGKCGEITNVLIGDRCLDCS
jgi:hypothetical protein